MEGKLLELPISKLSIPKASDILVEKLRNFILSDEVKEGDKLPPERVLVQKLGAGRSTIREALRILEIEGLIKTKPGPNGGSVVRRPTYQTVAKSLTLLLRSERASFAELLEARRIIERQCARQAAIVATAEDLAEFDDCIQQMKATLNNYPAFFMENLRFHYLITSSSHSYVLRVFARCIREIVYERIIDVELTIPQRQKGIQACEAIVEAIKEKNPDKAEKRFDKHLQAFEDHLKNTYPQAFSDESTKTIITPGTDRQTILLKNIPE